MKLKNVSPHGDLDIPLVRRIVPADGEFDATPEQAAVLLDQPVNFAPADDEAAQLLAKLQADKAEAVVSLTKTEGGDQ